MLLTKDDFKVGQVVACKHSGNMARREKGYTLGKVVKSGRKLITVSFNENTDKGIQFKLEESYERDYLLQKTNYSGDYELFPSEQAYFDYEEKHEKLNIIQSKVSTSYKNCDLTVDQVRRIYEVINED